MSSVDFNNISPKTDSEQGKTIEIIGKEKISEKEEVLRNKIVGLVSVKRDLENISTAFNSNQNLTKNLEKLDKDFEQISLLKGEGADDPIMKDIRRIINELKQESSDSKAPADKEKFMQVCNKLSDVCSKALATLQPSKAMRSVDMATYAQLELQHSISNIQKMRKELDETVLKLSDQLNSLTPTGKEELEKGLAAANQLKKIFREKIKKGQSKITNENRKELEKAYQDISNSLKDLSKNIDELEVQFNKSKEKSQLESMQTDIKKVETKAMDLLAKIQNRLLDIEFDNKETRDKYVAITEQLEEVYDMKLQADQIGITITKDNKPVLEAIYKEVIRDFKDISDQLDQLAAQDAKVQQQKVETGKGKAVKKAVKGKTESVQKKKIHKKAKPEVKVQQESEIQKMDPDLYKVHLKKFGAYVTKEIKREASEKLVNHLIDLGTELLPPDIDTKLDELGKLDKETQKKLDLVKHYETHLGEICPLANKGNHTIDEEIVLKHPSHKHMDEKYKIKVKQEPDGKWTATIKGEDNQPLTFQSTKSGDVGYHEASAWVHSQLDRRFYEETGFKDELDNIARGLGIAPQALSLLGNLGDLVPRRLGGTVAGQVTMISQGTDSFLKGTTNDMSEAMKSAIEAANHPFEIASASADIAGLCLILPSLLEARKAHKMGLEAAELDKHVDEYVTKIENTQKEIVDKYQDYAAKYTLSSTPDLEFKYYEDIEEFQKLLEKDLKATEGSSLKKKEKQERLDAINDMLNLTKNLFEYRELVNPIIEESNDLKMGMKVKIGNVSAGIVSSLACGIKAALTLNHLITGNVLNATATAACTSLGLIAGPLVAGGALIQLVADSRTLDKNVRKKKALRETMTTLSRLKDKDGNSVLSGNEQQLLLDIKRIEMRNINRKLVSMGLGVTADVAGIAVGTVATASVIVGAATMGVGVIAVPIIAGVAVGAKIGADAYMKWQDDKEQKEFIKQQPELSDIGVIARLNLAIRSRDKQPGAAAIAEHLLKGYFDIDPEVFLQATDGLVNKYHDLQIQAKRNAQVAAALSPSG